MDEETTTTATCSGNLHCFTQRQIAPFARTAPQRGAYRFAGFVFGLKCVTTTSSPRPYKRNARNAGRKVPRRNAESTHDKQKGPRRLPEGLFVRLLANLVVVQLPNSFFKTTFYRHLSFLNPKVAPKVAPRTTPLPRPPTSIEKRTIFFPPPFLRDESVGRLLCVPPRLHPHRLPRRPLLRLSRSLMDRPASRAARIRSGRGLPRGVALVGGVAG